LYNRLTNTRDMLKTEISKSNSELKGLVEQNEKQTSDQLKKTLV